MAGRRLALGLILALSACGPALEQPERQRKAPTFVPVRFFGGASRGEAVLLLPFSTEQVVVESFGRPASAGALMLDQTIRRPGRKPQQRRWVIRPAGQGRYIGTLTDAQGPITAEARGNSLRIRYRTKDGLDAEQWLYLAPDGLSAANRLGFSKWGVRVATIEEVIRKR